jgi:hypothetical protein
LNEGMEKLNVDEIKIDIRLSNIVYASKSVRLKTIKLLLESDYLTLKETSNGFIITINKDESNKSYWAF